MWFVEDWTAWEVVFTLNPAAQWQNFLMRMVTLAGQNPPDWELEPTLKELSAITKCNSLVDQPKTHAMLYPAKLRVAAQGVTSLLEASSAIQLHDWTRINNI